LLQPFAVIATSAEAKGNVVVAAVVFVVVVPESLEPPKHPLSKPVQAKTDINHNLLNMFVSLK
jgi:hypothetical protein